MAEKKHIQNKQRNLTDEVDELYNPVYELKASSDLFMGDSGLIGMTEKDATTLLGIINNTLKLFYHGNLSQYKTFNGLFKIDDKNKRKVVVDRKKLYPANDEIIRLVSGPLNEGEVRLDKEEGQDLLDLIFGYAAAAVSKKPIYVKYDTKEEINKGKFNDEFRTFVEKSKDADATKRKEAEKDMIIWREPFSTSLLLADQEKRKFIGDGNALPIKDKEGNVIANSVLILADPNPDPELHDGDLEVTTAHEILGHSIGHNFGIGSERGKIPFWCDEKIKTKETLISHDLEAVKFENIVRRSKDRDLERRGLEPIYGKRNPAIDKEPHGYETDTLLQKAQKALFDGEKTASTRPILTNPGYWNRQQIHEYSQFKESLPIIRPIINENGKVVRYSESQNNQEHNIFDLVPLRAMALINDFWQKINNNVLKGLNDFFAPQTGNRNLPEATNKNNTPSNPGTNGFDDVKIVYNYQETDIDDPVLTNQIRRTIVNTFYDAYNTV